MAFKETTLSREDLYAQVWSVPMRRLAQQYGISDVGLAKICKKHQIPRPPAGYWAKKEFGKPLEELPLPAVTDANLSMVHIRESPPASADEHLAEQKPVAQVAKQKPVEQVVEQKPVEQVAEQKPAVKNPELLKLIEREADAKNRISVSSLLRSPHPLIGETKQCLRDSSPDQYGKVRPQHLDQLSHLDVRVTKPSIPRVLLILDALVKALVDRGHKFELHGEGWHRTTCLKVLGERFGIQISEKSRQVEHKPTEEEKQQKQRLGFLYSRPKHDYVGTGVLDLQLMGENGYAINTWRDSKDFKIEDCLNDFVIATYIAVERQQDQRHQQKMWEIERRRQEQMRWEEEQRRRHEEARRKQLEEMATSWTKALHIRQFVAAVQDDARRRFDGIVDGSELASWILWANEHADRLDPVCGVAGKLAACVAVPIGPASDGSGNVDAIRQSLQNGTSPPSKPR